MLEGKILREKFQERKLRRGEGLNEKYMPERCGTMNKWNQRQYKERGKAVRIKMRRGSEKGEILGEKLREINEEKRSERQMSGKKGAEYMDTLNKSLPCKLLYKKKIIKNSSL